MKGQKNRLKKTEEMLAITGLPLALDGCLCSLSSSFPVVANTWVSEYDVVVVGVLLLRALEIRLCHVTLQGSSLWLHVRNSKKCRMTNAMGTHGV